jgi:hypothetical protein
MKKIISLVTVISSIFSACNSTSNSNESHSHHVDSLDVIISQIDSTHQKHINTDGKFDEVLSNYINLKNTLVNDDSKAAGNAGKAILYSLTKLSKSENKEELEILESIKENAEHIRDNSGKLDHQREHFALISKDIIDLIEQAGTSKKLYQDFCPMYDDNKGASWISEIKEIKNPFYGSKMSTCGSVKKEY